MPLLHEILNIMDAAPKFSNNLELIDLTLSGKLRGKFTDFLVEFYSSCVSSNENPSPDLTTWVVRTREAALSNLESLLERACREIAENKMRCYVADTREEVKKILSEIVGSGKTVFKSFSLTLEECGIGEHLSREGNEVYDAEFPLLMRELESDPLNAGDYREKIERAEFGITDAAALSVDPGALFLLPRSGLERLTSMVPPKHVAVVGLEQMVPSYEDGFKLVELAMRLDRRLNFASVVGGPSKTGDIEKKIVYGAHGPREVHVILLDNGRREAARRSPLKEALSLPVLGKVPCRQLWPFWKEILGMSGAKELALSLMKDGLTNYLGRDLSPLLNLL